MNSIVLVDSTGKCKINGQKISINKVSDYGLRIISPAGTPSAPDEKKSQQSLAHALALDEDGQLQSTFRKD